MERNINQFPTREQLESMTKAQIVGTAWSTAYKALCKHYRVPYDTPFAPDGFYFAPRFTKGYTKDALVAHCFDYLNKVKEALRYEVGPASEKQLAFIGKLTKDDTEVERITEGVTFTKVGASYLITLLKQFDYCNTSRDFDDIYNAIEELASLNKHND